MAFDRTKRSMRPSWLELKVPPLAVALLAALSMKLLAVQLGQLPLPSRLEVATSFVLLGLGVALILAASWSFRRHQTTVNPTRPTRSTELVTTGVYRISRNPIYLGMLCLLVAWGFRVSSPASWVMVPLFVWYLTRYQITPEERALRKIFGEAFESYLRRTRRWI